MNLIFDLEVEIRGKAASVFDADTINRRLVELLGKPQRPEIVAEIAYLEALKARKFPKPAETLVED